VRAYNGCFYGISLEYFNGFYAIVHSEILQRRALSFRLTGLISFLQRLLLFPIILPHATPQTPEEREALLQIEEKSLSFVEKAHEFSQKNPHLCPPHFDTKAFEIDFKDARGLWIVQNLARYVDELINDTYMTAGSEAYQAALAFYSSVKLAASQDVDKAKEMCDELKKLYINSIRKSDEA
jgi:hypothetical protein